MCVSVCLSVAFITFTIIDSVCLVLSFLSSLRLENIPCMLLAFEHKNIRSSTCYSTQTQALNWASYYYSHFQPGFVPPLSFGSRGSISQNSAKLSMQTKIGVCLSIFVAAPLKTSATTHIYSTFVNIPCALRFFFLSLLEATAISDDTSGGGWWCLGVNERAPFVDRSTKWHENDTQKRPPSEREKDDFMRNRQKQEPEF